MTTRYLALILIFIALQGSTCLDNKNVLQVNIYEMADAAFMKCNPYLQTAADHDCLLISNPQKRILRVFDATENQFILSPIGYSSLAVPVGSTPTSISTSKNKTFVLDVINADIYSIETKNQNGQAAFRKTDVTKAFKVPTGANRIFLTSSSELLIQVGANQIYRTNNQLTAWFTSSSTINHIAIDPQLKQLAIGTDTGFLLVDVASTAPTKVDVGGAIQRVAIGDNFALALMRDTNAVVVIQNNNIVGKATVSGRPLAAYIPQGNEDERNTSPANNKNPWAAILTASGDLQYIDLVTMKATDPASVSSKVVGVAGNSLGYPIKILGATIDNKRKMFLVYSRFIGSLIEGETEKIDLVALH